MESSEKKTAELPAEVQDAVPARGDRMHFLECVKNVEDALLAHLLKCTGNLEDAQDLLQETQKRAWKNWRSFDPTSSPWPWFRTIADNAFLSWHRSKTARKRDSRGTHTADGAYRHNGILEAGDNRIEPHPVDQSPEPWESASNREERRMVREVIDQLPDSLRAIARQRFLLEHEVNEIAQREGKTIGAINTALSRIREKVAKGLLKHGIIPRIQKPNASDKEGGS